MQLNHLAFALSIAAAFTGYAQDSGPYKLLRTAKVGGAGGFDYVYADAVGRRLYTFHVPSVTGARISVYNLDTLEPVGEIPNANARGVAVRLQVKPRIREQQARRDVGHQYPRND